MRLPPPKVATPVRPDSRCMLAVFRTNYLDSVSQEASRAALVERNGSRAPREERAGVIRSERCRSGEFLPRRIIYFLLLLLLLLEDAWYIDTAESFILALSRPNPFLKKNQSTPRPSEHPPVVGEKMSKRLGWIKVCKYKTSSWHLNRFPDADNIGSTV